jgi:hypothetical protein
MESRVRTEPGSTGRSTPFRPVVVVLGIFPLLISAYAIGPVRADVCRFFMDWAQVRMPGCDEDLRLVSADEAQVFFHGYYPAAGGTGTGSRAWAMLSTRMQGATGHANFSDGWRPYLFAEVVGQVEAGGERNTFQVAVRHYHETGRVFHRTSKHRLVWEDDRIRLHETFEDFIAPGDSSLVRERGPFDLVRVIDEEPYTYQLPRVDSNPAMMPDDMTVGGTLQALCQLLVTEPVTGEDGEWWVRTPQGWISSGLLDLGGDPLPGLTECDPHHAHR